MLSRLRRLDKPLVGVTVALLSYGLAALYSAGQTDVPTIAATIWQKQIVWIAVGLTALVLVSRVSPRLVEWATPYAYGATVLLLLVTLIVGTGAGTAAGSRSWLAIGGLRVGQPAELAKLAVILMLARWLAARREAPATLRDLLPPGVIVGVPFALVLLQPVTGIPLPFFSYGGSFLLACSLAVGIALRVSWESRRSGYSES